MPAIGLGTFMTFDVGPDGKRDNLFEVTRRYWEAGGRVIDTSPLYGMAEVNVGHFASALGINDQIFVSNKVWATGEFLGDADQGDHSLELSRERLWRDKIDLMQCHSLVNVDVMVPLMKAWKKEGRIKYFGVTHYETPYFEALADWVEKGNLDFVQVHYSIHTHQAEERILPRQRITERRSASTCLSKRPVSTQLFKNGHCRTSRRNSTFRPGLLSS